MAGAAFAPANQNNQRQIDMKKIQSLFILAISLLAFGAGAQVWQNIPVTIGATNLDGGNTSSNVIAAASAVTFTSGTTNCLIPLTRYDATAITVSSALMASGTSAVTAMFDASNDGTNWVTPFTYVTYSANGTTRAGSGTNLANIHYGYLRLTYVTNASNAVLTNLLVSYSRKPSRSGN